MRHRTEQFASLHRPPRRVRPPFDVAEDERDRWDAFRSDPLAWQKDQVDALLEALDGIELGVYDEQIVEWLAGWDIPTVGTVVSLIHRARAAGASDGAP